MLGTFDGVLHGQKAADPVLTRIGLNIVGQRFASPERRERGHRAELQKMKLTSVQTGIAGEYFVAAELSRRGFVASITLRNTRGIDILASNADATKSVGIQVKTCQGSRLAWVMNRKAEADLAENLFYVFVCLPPVGSPEYCVVPRKDVAKYVRESHHTWLVTPGRKGQAHRDTDMRLFKDAEGRFKDRWDLLGLNEPALSNKRL
jgi:hypothetical protein